MKAVGLTAEQLQPLFNDPLEVQDHMKNKTVCTKLANDAEGNPTYHILVNTPPGPVYNRSMFLTQFKSKDE